MADQTRHNGVFVDCENPDVEHEGVLILEQGSLPVIEIHDRHRRFNIFPRRPRNSVHRQVGTVLPRVVGRLAADLYVLATDVKVESVTHPSFGTYNTAELRVYGDLIHSADELLWKDDDVLASTLYVQIDRLEDWALPRLKIDAPEPYPPEWFATGLSLLPHSPKSISIRRADSPNVAVELPGGLRLRFRSELTYGSGDGGTGPRQHSATAHQHAVLVVDAIGKPHPVWKSADSGAEYERDVATGPVWGLYAAALKFRKLLRFVYDDRCSFRSMKATRSGRSRTSPEDRSIFDDPVPYVHSIRCMNSPERLAPQKLPLFRLDDIVGRPVVERWYGLDRYHRDVLDEMAGGTSQLYCASIAASWVGESAKKVVRNSEEKERRISLLMEDVGVDEWGVDTEMWGHRISLLRNDPMHGRTSSLSPDELDETCRVVVQLMKILTLRELGFGLEEIGQMVKHRRWTLAPSES